LKAYIKTGTYRFTILSILIIILGPGCSLTRRLDDNQALVRVLTIKGVDKEFTEAATNYVDKQQQPNNWINLQIYYLFNKKGKKNLGDPPAILDSGLVEFSRTQIERFLQNKGYLKAKVSDEIRVKKKRAELIFTATEGPMFRIRKITDSIPDKKVRDLYVINRPRFSHVQPGGRFDTDSLAYDRDEFFLIMKRNGYFDFYRQYINYNYDSTFMTSVVDLKLIINNPAGKKAHPLYTVNNTEITIANSAGQTVGHADTVAIDSQFKYIDYSHRFNPNTVLRYVFMRKGQLYDVDKQTLTTSRLSELNVFRNVPNPIYEKLPDSTNRLNSKIGIIPLKRMGNRIEAEFLFNAGQYGYNIGNTFTDRDLFKSAAVLQIKFNWSVLFDKASDLANPGGIENQDFRVGGSLIYPYIISPFDFPEPGKYGVPHTTFSSNYQLFYQENLVKRTSFINSITYDFAETADKLHTVTPIDIEFSRGIISDATRAVLTAHGLYAYEILIGRTIFTSGSQYAFTYHANKLNSYSNFVYFRGGVDVGGNTLYLLSRAFKLPKDTLGERTFAGRPFSQYAKGEFDLRIYKSLGGERQFVIRLNPGLGVPYGNSTELIFEKNFYAGGANDMRAWLPRTLGPGQFNRATYYTNLTKTAGAADTLRTENKYLDQYGEVKFISNFEYRYKLADNFFGSKLKGAVFIDAGNIWRLDKQFISDPNASPTQPKLIEVPNVEFRFNNILQSSAMDIGTGLRFDLGFFVFRLDAAFKFKDPQFSGSDQWVLIDHFDELFRSGSFKNNYKNANGGDIYNFMQLNFGIGMPF
jgi:outer membrane protein insertion porin family